MMFAEKCPNCGYQEWANWRPVFGPDSIIYSKSVTEAESIPAITKDHKPGDVWTDECWAYRWVKTGRFVQRIPLAIYNAEGRFLHHAQKGTPKFGHPNEYAEKKRGLIRRLANRKNPKQQKLVYASMVAPNDARRTTE